MKKILASILTSALTLILTLTLTLTLTSTLCKAQFTGCLPPVYNPCSDSTTVADSDLVHNVYQGANMIGVQNWGMDLLSSLPHWIEYYAQFSNPVNSWSTTGNAATTPFTNYIGTSDATPLAFGVNGDEAGFIGYNSANTAFGQFSSLDESTGQWNTAIGQEVMGNISSGVGNTAIGYETLNSLQSGGYNTVGGYESGLDITTGSFNTALGYLSLLGATTGKYNVAIGSYALHATLGYSDNTGIGNRAGYVNQASQNTFIGDSAGVNNTTGANNTFLGYEAFLPTATTSNSVVLGNSAVTGFYVATGGLLSTTSNAPNLYWNSSNGQVEKSTATLASGTVTSVATGYGLTGGTITTSGTLSWDSTQGNLYGARPSTQYQWYHYVNAVFAGSSNITTVGTIGSGTWQGSDVGASYGGTGQNTSSSTGVAQVSGGTWSVSTALVNGTTATTQSALDNSTKVATTAYVDGIGFDRNFIGRFTVTGADSTRNNASLKTSIYLTYSAPASSTFHVQGVLMVMCSGTGGVVYQLNGPSGATSTFVTWAGSTSNGATYTSLQEGINAPTSGLSAYSISTNYAKIYLDAYITTSSTAGAVYVSFKPVTNLQTVTLEPGSYFNVFK